LRRLSTQSSHNLSASILSSLQQTKQVQSSSTWDNSLSQMSIDPSSLSCSSSESMLSKCFERIFCELQVQVIHRCLAHLRILVKTLPFLQPVPTSLEQTLQLWHTLAQPSSNFDSTAIPLLQLQYPAVSGLMAALAWYLFKNSVFFRKSDLFFPRNPNVTLCTWTLAFQCLTLVANQPKTEEWRVNNIIEDPSFLKMLRKFLTGNGVPNHVISQNDLKG